MNVAKARDYFSAYYEGSLERGLRQSFETRLKEDAQLQAEYRAFERTMLDLDAMGRVEIEPPADLHEKIAARLDRAIWEQKKDKTPVLGMTWWKGVVMGFAVAAGVLVAFVGIKGYRANTAGILPLSTLEQFTLTAQNSRSVILTYPKVSHRVISIRDETKGQVIDTEDLKNQGIESKPLENVGDSAQLLSIEVDSPNGSMTYVALPGGVLDSRNAGQGTVKDLALAIAGHYGKPVKLQPKDDADKVVAWDFTTVDPLEATSNAVRSLNMAVQQNASGVISIEKD